MFRPYTLLLLLAFASSCMKSNSTGTSGLPGNSDSTAAVTDIGTPTGTPVTKTIGAGGGTIISSDGKMELDIPAGALPGDVAVTIQPITNDCPNGVGLAYDFLPNGTKFSTPATLIFHYTDDDINGTIPDFINLATQDSLNQWEVNIEKDVDTVAKTISYDVTHFSRKSNQSMINLKPDIKISAVGSTDLQESQQLPLVVSQGSTPGQLAGYDDGVAVYYLPKPKPVSDAMVSSWSVSSGSQNGTVSPTTGAHVTYTAPNTISSNKTVYVTAMVVVNANSVSRRHQKSRVGSGLVPLSIKINLHPTDINFSIKVVFDVPNTSGYYNDKYHDEVTFEVDVKNYIVTVPQGKIQNQAPTVTPPSGTSGTILAEWIPDAYGEINVTGGTGYVFLDSLNFNNRDISVILTSSNTMGPTWKTTDQSDGNVHTEPGLATPGWPSSVSFIYKDSVQVVDPLKGTVLQGAVAATITPIH